MPGSRPGVTAVLALAVSLLPAPLPALAQNAGAAAGDPSIVVGIMAALSGPGAMAGQDALDGFTLALRHMGGRFANQEVRLEVVAEGDSPDAARQAAARLLGRERVDVVLTAVSPASLAAIARPLTAKRMLVLNLDTAPPALAGSDCSPWLFDLAGQADDVHEAAGQHFATEHYRRIAVVSPGTVLAAEALEALKRTFPGEVAETVIPRRGAATFEAETRRLKELAPDAVYSLLTGGTGAAFARDYHAAGLKAEIPLYAQWRGFERPMLAAMGEAALDVTTFASWSPDFDMAAGKRMISDFEIEHGRPATTWVARGYDAALLLDAALKATHGRTHDADALRAALRRAEFASVRGAFRFNANHFPLSNVYVRKTTRDAKGRLTLENRGLVLREWRDRKAPSCPMRWEEAPPPVVKKGP